MNIEKTLKKDSSTANENNSLDSAMAVMVQEAAGDAPAGTGNETPTGDETPTGNETPPPADDEKKDKGDNKNKEAYAEVYHEIYKIIDAAKNDPRVGEIMLEFGMTAGKVEAGDTLLTDTKDYQELRDLLEVDRKMTTVEINDKQAAADDKIGDTISFCRTIFKKDKTMLTHLLLDKTKPEKLANWLARYEKIYKRVLESPQALETLAVYGITLERLQGEQAMVLEVAVLDARRQRLKAEAQDATQARNDSFRALIEWVSVYRDVAKIAFRNKEQLLEKVGIQKRSPIFHVNL
ncbi:MAG: hypothetical protein GY765_21085 [bacterium]|nr:hypothetical protein [bacterium]